MKKLAILCITTLGAALLVFGTAPSASAYPEISCDVQVSSQKLSPGSTFTVTGTVKPGAVDSNNQPVADAAINWDFTFNGETKSRTGHSVQASFVAPKVAKTRTFRLHARESSPAGTCVKDFDIQVVKATVAGPHVDDDGLPNTGGPAFWALVAGLVLLLGGGGAVVVSRRRS